MNVIGHPHVAVDDQTKPPCRFDHRIAKELVIHFSGEDRLPVIAALDNVLRLTGDDLAGKTGHLSNVEEGRNQQ
jgi:hypothetical protein